MSNTVSQKAGHKNFLIIAYLLGVVYLFFGIFKLIGASQVVEEFVGLWHFPLWFMYFLGVAQVMGGIGFFVSKLRKPAAFSMALIMIGAIVTNIISLNIGNIILCSLFLILCLLVYQHDFEANTV